MRKPNFFIIGAPKCGTTSLASWLGECPSIFVSQPKEPNYFNTDVRSYNRLKLHEYEGLFNAATKIDVAVGEATTGYLRSTVAVPNILQYAPKAKFIVCIRNPTDMCISLHREHVKSGFEIEKSFERAWNMQGDRSNGLRVPTLCADRTNLLYGPLCRIGTQLQRVITVAGFHNVLIVRLDQMAMQPSVIYDRAKNFLGVSNGFRPNFKHYNEAVYIPGPLARCLRYASTVKAYLGVRRQTGAVRIARRIFAVRSNVEGPSERFVKSVLYPYFKDEIDKLEGILNQDLSAWRDPQSVQLTRREMS